MNICMPLNPNPLMPSNFLNLQFSLIKMAFSQCTQFYFYWKKQNVSITKVYKLCYCCCSEHQVQFVPIYFHLSKAFVGAPGVGINLSAAITLQTES